MMINVRIDSQNIDFKDDLQNQIELFIGDCEFTGDIPDVIIVDDDDELYKTQRSQHPSTPIILLCSTPRINADNLNIIIKKPFRLSYLFDTIKAANNKLDNSQEGYLSFGKCELHPDKREILFKENKKIVKLTEKEISIIKYLYKVYPQYVSKNDLQKNVWKYSADVTTHTIETHIYRLRQKIEKSTDYRLILTESCGYKLNMD